jgi:two-component system, NtrC family, response regulator PilR
VNPRQILGHSPLVKEMLGLIHRVSTTKTNVLVIGESGTGKELVARMIHDSGPLKDRPFIPINCGAIPETLIESEMFGHRKGSFTGAVAEKAGLFEAAHGGTLFLDEVGELPLSMQVKLLRAIQERNFRKVGGTEDVKVDVRIIAATNRDLEAAVAKGTFREDLYYRLNVILIKTPALRDRRTDVRLLAETFLARASQKHKRSLAVFSPEALDALVAHSWPGNIRELENVVERAVTLESGPSIGLASLPAAIREPKGSQKPADLSASGNGFGFSLPVPDFSKGAIDLESILGRVEKAYLEAALGHSGGKKKKASELLGITFRSIRYRLSKQGMGEGGDSESEE